MRKKVEYRIFKVDEDGYKYLAKAESRTAANRWAKNNGGAEYAVGAFPPNFKVTEKTVTKYSVEEVS